MNTNMKVTTSLFLAISLLFIAVFGLTALDHSMSHQQSDCVVSIMTSAPCPTNLMSIVRHHLSAIQSFFNVKISIFIFSVILKKDESAYCKIKKRLDSGKMMPNNAHKI